MIISCALIKRNVYRQTVRGTERQTYKYTYIQTYRNEDVRTYTDKQTDRMCKSVGRQADRCTERRMFKHIYLQHTHTDRQTYFVREPIQETGEITRNFVTYRKLCEIKTLSYKISTFSKFQKVTFVNIPGVHKLILIYWSFLHSV